MQLWTLGKHPASMGPTHMSWPKVASPTGRATLPPTRVPTGSMLHRHSVHPSLTPEHALGQVRMWDIRTSGCVRVLDQHDTSAARTQCAPQPLTV